MRTMILRKAQTPLQPVRLPVPRPERGQVLIRVIACGICRTDLHVIDGELERPKLPLVPGHEIVGTIAAVGVGVVLTEGQLVGVPWLGYTCGTCRYCRSGRENLCENAKFTGYTLDGGYAEYTLAFAGYCFPLPGEYGNAAGAPLLCAGLIGYRSYSLIGTQVQGAGTQVQRIGLYGFGAAAHILVQVARYQGKRTYAFTRDGDKAGQDFALRMGANWAGGSSEMPPEPLDAAIIFAPAGNLIPLALQAVDKGGSVICGGIHMSDIPAFPYRLLWEERQLRSVANLTRKDGLEFLALAPKVPVRTDTTTYPLEAANEALAALRTGKIHGAAVLVP